MAKKLPLSKRARLDDTERDTQHGSAFEGEIVPVLVGSKLFRIHKSMLLKSSRFFARALKPGWWVAGRNSIDLSSENPAVFGSYCEWLYSDKLPSCVSSEYWEAMDLVIEMFLLGEILVDDSFRNTALDQIIRLMRKVNPSIENVNKIYGGTPEGSPAQRLMVDVWAVYMEPEWVGADFTSERMNADFMKDLILAMSKYRGKSALKPWNNPDCYHF